MIYKTLTLHVELKKQDPDRCHGSYANYKPDK